MQDIKRVKPSNKPGRGGRTVEEVDLNRYFGRWFEIARLPAELEKDCRCATAEYSPDGNEIVVKNRCIKNGREVVARATAHPVAGSNDSRWSIRYGEHFAGDYWIIALDENYEFAMVGEPERQRLWILSRSPRMDEKTYRSLVETARAKGYPVDLLQKTDQSCYQ